MTEIADPPADSPADRAGAARRRRRGRIVLVVLVLLAALITAFLLWFFRGDAPDEVNLTDAAGQVADNTSVTTAATPSTAAPATAPASSVTPAGTTAPAAPTASTAPTATTAPAPAAGDVSGTWTVDTSIGEFSYEDSTGTFVGFRIAEELAGIGAVEAVGRTPEVSGTLEIDGTTLTAVAIEADMASITTNDSRRDDNVWSALDTDTFPTGTFTLTEPVELGEAALAGEPISVEATGELTLHGVTQAVTIPLDAQLVDDTIVVVGRLDITFADYGVTVPSAPIVVSVDDFGVVELQLFFTR